MTAHPVLKLLLAGWLLICLAGCTEEKPTPVSFPSPPLAAASPAIPAPTSLPAPTVDPKDRAERIVHDPDAWLAGVHVDLRPGPDVVTSAWSVSGRRSVRTAAATSEDGFATTTFELVDHRARFLPLGPPRPEGAPEHGSCTRVARGTDICSDYSEPGFALQWTSDGGSTWSRHSFTQPPLLCGPETSLRPGSFAAVCGGDGATLLPFQLALRSADFGETWRSFELPMFDGERAYVAGSVVTSDGRLLSLLNNFSGDRRNRPSVNHHGLYASAGDDWSSYSVVEPRFTPPLTGASKGFSALSSITAQVEPDPVIFATTWDHRVYISTDDAKTFRGIPVR